MATDSFSTKSASAAVLHVSSLESLSFTFFKEGHAVDLWRPANCAGDWTEQCALGREYASEALVYTRTMGDATLLSSIARRISERGTFSGVEVGFFTALAERLI